MSPIRYDPEKVDPETKEKIEEATEHMLYFLINTMGETRFRSKHDSADNRPWARSIPDSMEFEEELFHQQGHCIRQLSKFGVEKPLENDSDAPTQEYWNWFRGWKDHVEGLPPEEWAKFEEAMNTNDDAYEKVARWYPECARQRRGNAVTESPERQDRFDAIDVETEGGEPE